TVPRWANHNQFRKRVDCWSPIDDIGCGSLRRGVPQSEGYTDMAGERVLVIDDSPTITKVVQLVLTKAGYQVETARDVEPGPAAVRQSRPDLILLDFVMPKMTGYEFCRGLTADPKLRDIPVILMSAKGDQVGERFVKVMGIVDYITKPFSP